MLERPVELACGNSVCCNCCCEWVTISGNTTCPCCYSHPLAVGYIHAPSHVVLSVLQNLLIECDKGCKRNVKAANYQQHVPSRCKEYYEDSAVTIKDILSKSADQPTSSEEKKVAENLIKRMMAENEKGSIIKIPTHGQVSY